MRHYQILKGRKPYFKTKYGAAVLGDSREVLQDMPDDSVDLIMTSPPYGLIRQKEYGNPDANEYIDWFREFAQEFYRVLKPTGSFVLDVGGAWVPKQPTRSLYHFRLLIDLCDNIGFHLAQEFYWWNPGRLPSPARWVTVKRIRVKDAVDTVWWLSKTPWPKANNRRVLVPYSESQMKILTGKQEVSTGRRPSGHEVTEWFGQDNKGAIPPNLLAIANTESNSRYLRYCREKGIKPHPARFPGLLPEFFIRMLTDPGDLVVDPFAGSCVTGEVCERLKRSWLCIELSAEYLDGAKGRFPPEEEQSQRVGYRVWRPDALWKQLPPSSLNTGKKVEESVKNNNPLGNT